MRVLWFVWRVAEPRLSAVDRSLPGICSKAYVKCLDVTDCDDIDVHTKKKIYGIVLASKLY